MQLQKTRNFIFKENFGPPTQQPPAPTRGKLVRSKSEHPHQMDDKPEGVPIRPQPPPAVSPVKPPIKGRRPPPPLPPSTPEVREVEQPPQGLLCFVKGIDLVSVWISD